MMPDKMAIDEARWWAEIAAENYLDPEYQTTDDSETHFKVAAIRRLIERNNELETALEKLDKHRDDLGNIIGPVL